MNFVFKNEEFCVNDDEFCSTRRRNRSEFCIENEEFCIKNEEICIQNEEFCIQTAVFYQIELWRLPPVLIVHLKRFAEDARGRMHKIQSLVTFPTEGLDLSEFIAEDCDLPSEDYDLFALSNHYGILGGGHYVAQGLFPETGQWYNFNDSAVTPMEAGEI